jgi:hypothetical protein
MSHVHPRITLQQALKRLMDGMDDGQQGEEDLHISAPSSASPASVDPGAAQSQPAGGSPQLTRAAHKHSTNVQDSLTLAELHQADGDDELSSDADGAQPQPQQQPASRPRRPAKRGRSRSRSRSSSSLSVQLECSVRSRSRSTRRRIFSRASQLGTGVESSDPQLTQSAQQQQEDMDDDNAATMCAMQQLHAQQQLAHLLRHGRARSEAGLRKRSSMDRQQMRGQSRHAAQQCMRIQDTARSLVHLWPRAF